MVTISPLWVATAVPTFATPHAALAAFHNGGSNPRRIEQIPVARPQPAGEAFCRNPVVSWVFPDGQFVSPDHDRRFSGVGSPPTAVGTPESTAMEGTFPNGTKKAVNGQWRVFYDGYWIKAYDVPADTLLAKKKLIEALTRRLFNHVEYGLNIPGTRLEEARRAFEQEGDPRKQRVKGAMLAGALFNRATDVFTKVVEIQSVGIEIRSDDVLMKQCGDYLQEALALGKMVLLRCGDEGIDELWGEPFKAFAFPIEEFYRSRYLKIALAMHGIDRIAHELDATFRELPMFAGAGPLIGELGVAARAKSETLQTDAEIFDVWAAFVAAGERLLSCEPVLPAGATTDDRLLASQGMDLLHRGKDLILHITRARVPMPKSTRDLIEECARFRTTWVGAAPSAREAGEDRPASPSLNY
jgi:hypothetical protein